MDDPLQPHRHDPNPEPPSADASFVLTLPNGRSYAITVDELNERPQTAVANHYVVSTGHGTSGPFTFSGVTLLDFIQHYLSISPLRFSEAPMGLLADGVIEVISADGFGNRVYGHELLNPSPARPILLCTKLNGRWLTRQEGLVRMIVPNETDDALRQVKWVGQINVKTPKLSNLTDYSNLK